MWPAPEMVFVFIVGVVIVDDDMSVENWFDELGKDRMRLTTGDEDAGFRCEETEDFAEDFGWEHDWVE